MLVNVAVLCAALSGCHSLAFGDRFVPPGQLAAPPRLGPPVDSTGQSASVIDPTLQTPLQESTPTSAQVGSLIDLADALRRAGADNPTIALAEEIVRQRRAELTLARVLLFPTLEAGTTYRYHQGSIQTTTGTMTNVDDRSLYYGFGADVRGSGTPLAPGIRLVAQLSDAIYAPQAARQLLVAGQSDAVATRHNILLDVGVAYLALVEAHARLAAYRESLGEFQEIANLTAAQAQQGQGKEPDARRAFSEAELLRGIVERAKEKVGVAAAELARLLDIDPSAMLRPVDVTPPLLEMVDPNIPLPDLLRQAWRQRPEILARGAEVRFQEIRLRQEKMRPFLPLIALGFSAGEYGGGNDQAQPHFGNFSARTDLDLVAVWSLQGLGAGNRAIQNTVRAGLGQAQYERNQIFDLVSRQVAQAHALVQARRQEIDLARARIESSRQGFAADLLRARNLQALPIEVLTTVQQLADARQALVGAMIGYSQAQLQLYVALGNRPSP